MTLDKEKFATLCRDDSSLAAHDGDSIGTYSEKRIHRIFKRMVCDNAENYEVKIGKFVADVLENSVITEIQTGSFLPLAKKLEYYLENTDFEVRVIAPIIENKTIVRTERDTGEIMRQKLSPKHESDMDVLAKMYPLAHIVENERFSLYVPHLAADEYRYSEARRYNKKGRYDSDTCPREMLCVSEFHTRRDYLALFPLKLCDHGFTVNEFSRLSGLRGRKAYTALKFFTLCGALSVEKQKNKNIYKKTEI